MGVMVSSIGGVTVEGVSFSTISTGLGWVVDPEIHDSSIIFDGRC